MQREFLCVHVRFCVQGLYVLSVAERACCIPGTLSPCVGGYGSNSLVISERVPVPSACGLAHDACVLVRFFCLWAIERAFRLHLAESSRRACSVSPRRFS